MKALAAKCPNCDNHFHIQLGSFDLDHENIAEWILTHPLTEILKLQSELAQRGVSINLSTPDVVHLQE